MCPWVGLVRETLVSQVIEALLPGGQTICSATPEPVPFHQFVMILLSRLQKCGIVIYATLDFIVFIHLNVRQWRVYCYCSTGTIAPLVKAPNISDHKPGGGEGLKMMVTISCVLVGIAVIFTGLLMLRRRRREQRLKRLRGERRAVTCHSLVLQPVQQMFSLFILQMPKVWLRCSWGKRVHNQVWVAKKEL